MSENDKTPSRPGYLLNCSVSEKLEFFAVCRMRGAIPASFMRQWMRELVREEKSTRPSEFAEALVEVKEEIEAAAQRKKAKADIVFLKRHPAKKP
jgi:hypothetical protein